MICQVCKKREAFYCRPFEGVNLCIYCFKRSIENKVKRTISKYKMLKYDDNIGVAVSGGKDSLTLLQILKKFSNRFERTKIYGIMIDEGIEGYRSEAIYLVLEACEELDISLTIITFKELYGLTLDELVNRRAIQFPCSYCGVLRRRALERAASHLHVDRLATAHNLDDEVQTSLLNLFHGDPYRIIRNKPRMDGLDGLFPIRIKPLSMITEKEISLYAYLNGIKFQRAQCPYSQNALRNDVRRMVNYLEERHPGIKYTLYHSLKKLQTNPKEDTFKKKRCNICGNISSSEICNVCKILEKNDTQTEEVFEKFI